MTALLLTPFPAGDCSGGWEGVFVDATRQHCVARVCAIGRIDQLCGVSCRTQWRGEERVVTRAEEEGGGEGEGEGAGA